MSEFDKEKEREKLREQLEADEERRKSTKQMSELLLKGATMLNIHCDRCASPIFRYDGEEFCPTCERSVTEIQEGDTTTDDGSTPDVEERKPDQRISQDTQLQEREVSGGEPQVPRTNAGEALEATISRLADRAATAEDPRQAAELLDAAHTAAETLVLVESRRQSGS